MGLRGLIMGLRGLSFGPERADFGFERADFGLERADLGPERGLGGGDVRTYGRLEIHPCVLQDIGPLGPLPKKRIRVTSHPRIAHGQRYPMPCLE